MSKKKSPPQKGKTRTTLSTLLKKYHTGAEHAVTGKELELSMGLRRQTIQKEIRRLRQSGVPICSSGTGYFYAETRQDIAETVAWLNRRINTMVQTQSLLLGTTPDEREKVVVVLPEEGLKVSLNIKSMKKG